MVIVRVVQSDNQAMGRLIEELSDDCTPPVNEMGWWGGTGAWRHEGTEARRDGSKKTEGGQEDGHRKMGFLREDAEDGHEWCAVHWESFLWDGVLRDDEAMGIRGPTD
jgi:hypothetical protein